MVAKIPLDQFGSAQQKALPYREVSGFLRKLQKDSGTQISRLAFELMILTATRMKQVISARFSEFDLATQIWVIPAGRTTVGQEFKVPLSARAVSVVRKAREIDWDRNFVFPGRKANTHLSDMTFLMLLRRMRIDATADGFRSSFGAWAAEMTDFGPELVEMALAQKTTSIDPTDNTFETYRRLMTTWAAFLDSDPASY